MKIYSFETITSIEDVRQIPSYVPLGEQSILIPPSFPWIKDKLQDIAISLYNFDWEKLPTLIDALKTKTFEFTSQLTGATENSPATISIIENLFQSLHSFVNRPLNQIKDKELLSFTERLSGLIIYSYFKTLKVNVSLLDPSLFVCIGSNSKIDTEKSAECLRTLIQDQDAIVSILPARICKNGLEETILMPAKLHTLYATHMATLFHAEELTFYTTKQMSSASPDEDVCSQFKDYTITYNEAKSIINAGFNLVPKASLDLAGQHGINLRISNYYNPNKQTITITKTSTMNQIKAVVTRKNADYLQIHSSGNLMPFQFLTKVMAVCGDFKTPIHLISSSSVNISMAVELSSETFHQMENQLSQFASVSVEKDISVIHIIGQFDQEKENMEVKVIDLLKDIPILMISYGSDNNSVSVVVSKDMGEKAQAILMDNLAGQDFMKRNVAPRFREAYSAMSI